MITLLSTISARYPSSSTHTPLVKVPLSLIRPNHAVIFLCTQILMSHSVCFLAVIVISVDNQEWCVNHTFHCYDCLTSTPRFGSLFSRNSILIWYITNLLVCVFNIYFIFYYFADYFFKISKEILADNKHNLVKPASFAS